jgi:serine/threonine protein kinase
MEAKPAPSASLPALPEGTVLVGDYRIKRVLGAGGFGITYLADEQALGRLVTIKEYFPAEFAARRNRSAVPRSRDVADDYQWGLDRFIEEAQTLARFDHANVVRVHRYFRANDTAYMVLKFEEGGSFKAWLKDLKRAPRQAELDTMIAPLLDALEIIHAADFLHRDIAPDNIMVRKDGSPVLIDFGSARGAMASQSRTVSALVKPGYSPYEQYATSGANQGPWTDIYALGATLYHAITGKRPPDAPSRVVKDEYVPAREAASGSYRDTFLEAIDEALRIEIGERPERIADWRKALFAADPARKPERLVPRQPLARKPGRLQKSEASASAGARRAGPAAALAAATSVPPSLVPAPPDAPQPKGQLLDFIEALRKYRPASAAKAAKAILAPAKAAPAPAQTPPAAGKSVPVPEHRKPGHRKQEGKVAAAPAEKPLPPDGRPPDDRLRAAPAALRPAPSASFAADAGAPKVDRPPQRSAPEPSPRRSRRLRFIPSRRWRIGIARVAAAVAVATLAVTYQEHVLRSASHPGAASEVAGSAPFLQLVGHLGPVIAVVSGDEGRWIVSAGTDATVRVWSGTSGALVRTIELSEGAVTAFAVDERRALVGHRGGTIVLWDLEDGARLATVQHGTDAITSLAFLGKGFVAARQDGSVALFEAAEQATPAALLDSEEGGGRLIAAAHNRSLFVSGGTDRTLRIWKAPGPRLTRTYGVLAEDVTAIDIAPDAGSVASGGSDGLVRIWPNPALRPLRGRTVQTLKAHDGGVAAVALGPSGTLATAGADGSVKVWSLRPAPVARSLASGQVRTLSFSRDGRRVFAGGEDGLIRVWTLTSLPAMGAI